MANRGVKLTLEQEEDVRASYRLTKSIRKTATDLKLSTATVHGIVKTARREGQILVDLRSVVELESRRLSWVSVGATVLEKQEVHRRLQTELAGENPDPAVIRQWAGVLKDLQIAYGIDVEKARLLNEQATQITAGAAQLRSSMPAGMTTEIMVRVTRQLIGSEPINPALLPPVPDGRS